ncbi:uncharacterized protein LOC129740964 [Uranotaenia lowii]|uniref:uncharacterized protein LOC129740964 n=1 Tax=Uranotaenia lowii TaxID=190385 RepID=UPI002478F342|nr:uncharacterized protein LOC129740964 [Uranotaenia lowii]XP_055588605.1 uncharacterized protein LOC129740964 [Uranotaenia lowii]
MNKLFIGVLFALVGTILAAPSQLDGERDVAECFEEILQMLERENVEELADVIVDARATFAGLLERHRRCQELPRDDPPTRLQQAAIDACENAWRLSVAFELARLSAAIAPHVSNSRDLIDTFQECSGIELERPAA